MIAGILRGRNGQSGMGESRCDDGVANEHGGRDALRLKAKANVLSRRALGLKRVIEKEQGR